MKTFTVRVLVKQIEIYEIKAESAEEAMENVMIDGHFVTDLEEEMEVLSAKEKRNGKEEK